MRIGERVELHPGCDAWMRGDRYGEIVAVIERKGHPVSVRVKLDKSGRVLRLDPSRAHARDPRAGLGAESGRRVLG